MDNNGTNRVTQNATSQTAASGQPQVIIAQSPKNMGIALLLAFLFGPIGLCYSTVKGGIIMFIVTCAIGILTLGLGLLITWIPCVIWAYVATNQYNKELLSTGRIPQ